jgi:hypothetical protein
VSALKAVTHRDLIPLCNLVEYSKMQVWEGRTQTLDELPVLGGAMDLPAGIVPHEIRRKRAPPSV